MKPVGLPDPRTGREPHAVVQLRREDRAGQMWNLVGFQTRLRIPEQQRVFRMIPGLEQAEYLRFGSIHRNSYLNSPASLGPALTARDDDRLFFAGQLTGVEGYTESLGTGLLAGINLARRLEGKPVAVPPPTTMLGGLYRYLREADPKHFQPMNANFGLLEPLAGKVKKDRKKELLVERAQAELRGAGRIGDAPLVGGVAGEQPASVAPPASTPEVAEFLTHLDKERGQSPHTVKAYGRDLEAFTEFCDRHYGRRLDLDDASTGSASAASSASCSGAGSPSARRRGRSRRCGASTATCRSTTAWPNNSPARRGCRSSTSGCPTYLDRGQTERCSTGRRRGGQGDDFAADARPRDARAVLFHRHPALRAERA